MLSFGVLTATAVEYLYPHPSPLQRLTEGITQRLLAVAAISKKMSGASLTQKEQNHAAAINQLSLAGTGPLRQILPTLSSLRRLNEHDLFRLAYVLQHL